MTTKNEIPRRVKMQEWCDAEKAIHNAMQEVEKMKADVRLTDAVVLLGKAQNAVADFIDNVHPIQSEVMYPEEFIRWISFGNHPFVVSCEKDGIYTDEFETDFNLPELFQYFNANVRNK